MTIQSISQSFPLETGPFGSSIYSAYFLHQGSLVTVTPVLLSQEVLSEAFFLLSPSSGKISFTNSCFINNRNGDPPYIKSAGSISFGAFLVGNEFPSPIPLENLIENTLCLPFSFLCANISA